MSDPSASGEIQAADRSWLKVAGVVLAAVIAVVVPPAGGTMILSEKLDGLKLIVRENTQASRANTRELNEIKVSMEERKLMLQRLSVLEAQCHEFKGRVHALEVGVTGGFEPYGEAIRELEKAVIRLERGR